MNKLLIGGVALLLFIVYFTWRSPEPEGICQLEELYTVEEVGYSKAPYVTGCSGKARNNEILKWCVANPDEPVKWCQDRLSGE